MYDLEYPDVASVSAVELFRLFGEECRNSLKLATAVRMNATFPYVTSSITLPVDPPRHVVDAGYYDNYGVNLAAAWIASHRVWISDKHVRRTGRPVPRVSQREATQTAERGHPRIRLRRHGPRVASGFRSSGSSISSPGSLR